MSSVRSRSRSSTIRDNDAAAAAVATTAEANQYLAAAATVPLVGGHKRRRDDDDDNGGGGGSSERRVRLRQTAHYWRNQPGRFQRMHIGANASPALVLPSTITQLPALYTYGCCPECECPCRTSFNLAAPQQQAIWIVDRVPTQIALTPAQGLRYVHLRRFGRLFRAQCLQSPTPQPHSPHQEYVSVQHLLASQPPMIRVHIARSEFFEAVCFPRKFHFAAADVTVAAILLPDRSKDWQLGGSAPRWGVPYYELGGLLDCWPVDGRDGLKIQARYGRLVADLVMLPVAGVLELALCSYQTRKTRARSDEPYPRLTELIYLLTGELPDQIDAPERRCTRRNLLNHLLRTRIGYPPADQFVLKLAKLLLYGGPLLWCNHQRKQLLMHMSILQPTALLSPPPPPVIGPYRRPPRIVCCVCLDSDRATHNVLVPCGHLVCSRCLFVITDYWYRVRTTVGMCPVCRRVYTRYLPVAPDDYERLAIAKLVASASAVVAPASSRLAAAAPTPLLTLPPTTQATVVPMTPRASALVAASTFTPTSPPLLLAQQQQQQQSSPPPPPPMALNVPPLCVLDPCGHVVSSSNRLLVYAFPVEEPHVCHQCQAVVVGLVRVYPQVDEGCEVLPPPPPAIKPKPLDVLRGRLSDVILGRRALRRTTANQTNHQPNNGGGDGDQPNTSGDGDQPNNSGDGDQPNNSGDGDQPNNSGDGDQPNNSGDGDQPNNSGDGDQPNNSGDGDQPNNSGDGNHRRE